MSRLSFFRKSLHTFANVLNEPIFSFSNTTVPLHLACALHILVLAINRPTESPLSLLAPLLKAKISNSLLFLQISPAKGHKNLP
jgi:hypothetical protein